MNRIQLDFEKADTFVREQIIAGNNVRWDGWTMVFFQPNKNGFNDRNGAFLNGRWGIQVRVDPDEKGIWSVPIKYVKPV